MTQEDYDARFAAQGFACLICGSKDKKSSNYVVDHDHKTGKIRGIICRNCNTGIGQLNDDPELIRTAATYLDEDVWGRDWL